MAIHCEVLTGADGARIGIATLDAPKALNALSLPMIEVLGEQLHTWARDPGVVCVLLLNTTMTVERANAASHAKKGWEFFTDRVIQVVSEQCPNVVFLLWGAHAQSKQKLIDGTKHLVLKSVHPSPLSAYRGFLGCGHFSRANSFLQQRGLAPINWALPPL